jgi:hypothetical protein
VDEMLVETGAMEELFADTRTSAVAEDAYCSVLVTVSWEVLEAGSVVADMATDDTSKAA